MGSRARTVSDKLFLHWSLCQLSKLLASTLFSRCVAVQLLSHACLFVTPWITALQAPLSSTISQSLLKFMSIESARLSNHLILCSPFTFCPQSFPASGSLQMNQLFASGGQSVGASASVLPMDIHGNFL